MPIIIGRHVDVDANDDHHRRTSISSTVIGMPISMSTSMMSVGARDRGLRVASPYGMSFQGSGSQRFLLRGLFQFSGPLVGPPFWHGSYPPDSPVDTAAQSRPLAPFKGRRISQG
ncbi:hypothetical protein QCM80_41380 [Bradyrhizobium sp. SSUT112]|uniref:hypothetical protein n=1 Tax=Bradyrhizobium sp. SSUT112 TaxID=3040604 RepID=UPI00244C2D1A|nr:hypothetical protein [Bradyrhizobium sp. SSUT112]MDH2357004.1 hypothetical protein [Bradyrhizobium sp. SSUT112]